MKTNHTPTTILNYGYLYRSYIAEHNLNDDSESLSRESLIDFVEGTIFGEYIKIYLSNGDTAFQADETDIYYNGMFYKAYEDMDGLKYIQVGKEDLYIEGEIYNSPVHGEIKVNLEFASDYDGVRKYADEQTAHFDIVHGYNECFFLQLDTHFFGFINNEFNSYYTLSDYRNAVLESEN